MSDTEEYYPAQFVVHCDFCDTELDVTWVCHTCDVSICQKCKDIHLGKEKFRDHKVLRRGETEPNLPLQGVKCEKHSPKEYSAFCRTCEIPVCMNCVIQDHEGHKFTDLREEIDRYKSKIRKYRDTIVQNCLPDITRRIKELQKTRVIFKTESDDIISSIEKEENAVVAIVQKAYGKCREDVRKMQVEREAEVGQTIGSLERNKSSVEKIVKKCDEKIRSRSVNVIRFTKECPSLTDVNPTTHLALSTFCYVPGQIDEKIIRDKMGKFSTTSKHEAAPKSPEKSTKHSIMSKMVLTTFQSSLPGKGSAISDIVSISSTEACLSYFFSSELHLHSDRGVHLKTVPAGFEAWSFAVDNNGNFIASDFDNKCIKKITPHDKVTTIIDSLPSNPCGLCLNQNQEIVMCLYLKKTLFVYSSDGQKCIHEIGNQVTGDSVFVSPYRVAQNGNLDYCVVDDYSKLVVTDVKGSYRWTYIGQVDQEGFNPNDVACDQNNCVVISDEYYHKVHVVDKDGQFIDILLTRDHGIDCLRALCVDQRGRLWVGQGDGKVHVIKYKSY